MHPVGGRRSVEDVIVAGDFTFAASPVMGDDVTGLGFPTCDAVDALTFSSLGHWRPRRFNAGARAVRAVWIAPENKGSAQENVWGAAEVPHGTSGPRAGPNNKSSRN